MGTHSKGAWPTKSRVQINPAEIAKILVYYNSEAIQGFKFYDKNNTVVSEAGNLNAGNPSIEVAVQAGERLLQIKS